MSDYDVIVIGSGAGGGTLARHLAPSGQAHPAARARRLAPARAAELARARRLRRQPLRLARTRGTTATASPSSRRCTTASAAPRSSTAPRCTACARRTSASCATTTASRRRGPSSYDEMEPYYTRAEQLYHVHGARGEDPTEPPASAPYPFPAVSHEPRIQQLADDLAAAGRQPFHAPCGVMLAEDDMPHSACVRCSTCDGFPCLVHAKSDAEVLGVRPALEHPNVTLLTNAQAVRLETNDAGTAVTGVVVERDGARETYTGDIVVVSCGAANSAKLLLASASDAHPNGLANGSDQVGRNYMFHNCRPCWRSPRSPTPRSSRRRSGSTTSTSAPTTSTTRWATSRWSASRRPRCTAARSRSRPGSRPSGRSRRWHATRSTSGSRPRTCRCRRTG